MSKKRGQASDKASTTFPNFSRESCSEKTGTFVDDLSDVCPPFFGTANELIGGRRAALLLFAFFPLAACTPRLDWRDVTVAEDGFKITFPAKPGKNERTLNIAGQPATMRMHAVTTQDTVFGVGVVDFRPVAPPNLLAQFRAAAARNIHANPSAIKFTEALIDGLPSSQFEGEGSRPDGTPLALLGRLALRKTDGGERLYQVLQIGRRGALQDADHTLFVQSFSSSK